MQDGRFLHGRIVRRSKRGLVGQEQIFEEDTYFFLTMMRSGVPVNWYVSRSWFSKYFR